jgi:hypothetical protein
MGNRCARQRDPSAANARPTLASRILALTMLAAAGCGLVSLTLHVRLFAGRATFPLDLEWLEGGMLVHAQRIASGQGIYVPPSVDFIPYLYTPLYPALLALLSFIFPLGYTLGRVASILSLAGAGCFLFSTAKGETSGDRGELPSWLVGVAGVGAVVAAFAFTGGFYDLVRADSLLLLFEVFTLWLAMRGTGWKSAAASGVAIALAFFTKQTAAIVGVGIGIGLLIANWRRGLSYGVAAAGSVLAGVLLLLATSHGWFWTYVFKLHQSHPFDWDAAFKTAPWAILKHTWPALLALILATLALAALRKLSRADALLCLTAAAGILAAMVGFGTKWAYFNAYIPGVFFPCLAAAVLTTRLVVAAKASPSATTSLSAIAAVALLGFQSQHGQQADVAKTLPSSQDRIAAARLLSEIESLPGPVFIPFHPYYAVLAGKHPFVHRIGLYDIEATLGRPDWLAQAIGTQKFAAIVLDWRPRPGEWPGLDANYRPSHEFIRGRDSVGTFAGVQTSPRLVFVPTR